jgi:polysaccharide deacetylase family protein (PEP-CTERM system associated)
VTGSALTIDWEDFGQLYWFYEGRTVEPPRDDIARQTDLVLQLLEDEHVRATFFVLGMLARFRPDLVKEIHGAGHEIGIHGDLHIRLTERTSAEIRDDIKRAIDTVTGVTGMAVSGYRAPIFSVRRDNLAVLDLLAEEGIEYDSSVFPVALRRYGIADFAPEPANYALPSGRTIVELPLTTVRKWGRPMPVAGGTWLRVIPRRALLAAERICAAEDRPFVMYLHPYEFDDQRLDIGSNYPPGHHPARGRRAVLNLRWNVLRGTVPAKVRAMLRAASFVTCKELADEVRESQRPRVLEPTA